MKQRNLRQEKGITLIALVITIIVMLILVAVTVSIAINGGLFNYAKQASSGYDTSRIKEEFQVGIYGVQMEYYINGEEGSLRDYIFSEAPGEGQELLSTELGAANLEFDAENNQITYKGIIFEIAENGEATIVGGTAIPETNNGGNGTGTQQEGRQEDGTFIYGDYQYKYNYRWIDDYEGRWYEDTTQNGWGVRVLNKTKTSYGEIRSSVDGYPVVNMDYTFKNCTQMTSAPEIPNSVTSLSETFSGCTALTNAPEIPNGITWLDNTFEYCTAMTTAPTIPNGVTYIGYIFMGCTNLKTYVGSTDSDGDFSHYIIPNSVTNLAGAFSGCTSLTTAPAIPNNVVNMRSTFSDCTALTAAPTLPSGVTDMGFTFSGCTHLKTYVGSTDSDGNLSNYVLPSSLENLGSTFYECVLLTNSPTIPSNVTNMGSAFAGCTALTTAPAIPNKVTYLQRTFQGCTAMTTASTIPNSVTNVHGAFEGCSSLTGTIVINANNVYPYENRCLPTMELSGML